MVAQAWFLGDFAGVVAPRHVYFAAEDGGNTHIVVTELDDGCAQEPSIDYSVAPDTAGAADFEPKSGTVEDDPTRVTTERTQVAVPVLQDADQEQLEHAHVELTDPIRSVLKDPYRAPLYILDDDGGSRIVVEAPARTQHEFDINVSLPVFRLGDDTAAATVAFSLTSSDGATEGDDYTNVEPAAGVLEFAAGQRAHSVKFKLTNDYEGEDDETITMTMSAPAGAVIDGPSSTALTVVDDDNDPTAPVSKFHHPRDGWTYGRRDSRAYEFHIFGRDSGGSEMRTVQIALCRKMKSGACAWWGGRAWRRGGCNDRLWKGRSGSYGQVGARGTLYYYRMKRLLRPSVGDSSIRNYTIYSRAIDKVRNLETRFDRGRNKNHFDIRRGRRTTST